MPSQPVMSTTAKQNPGPMPQDARSVDVLLGKGATPLRDAAPLGEAKPLQILHRSLRGRYPLVIFCVLVLGVVGGFAGWRATQPQYRSDALIEIKYVQPAVDPAAAQSGPTPFQVLIDSQRTLITSRRVVDKALGDPAWTAVARPATPQLFRDFIRNLEVKSEEGTEYLRIGFTDTDARVAAAAVRAVTNAYVAVYKENEEHLESARLKVLKQNRSDLEERIRRMQAEIDEMVKKFGSADLAPLQSAAVMRTTRLDSAIDDIHLVLASLAAETQPQAVNTPAFQPAVQPPPRLTPQQIAQTDPVMRGYVDDQRKLQEDLQLREVQGYGESHLQVIELKYRLQRAEERVRQYAQEYAAVQQATGRTTPGGTGGPAVLAMKSPDQLRGEEEKLAALRDNARREMADLEVEHVRQMRRDSDLRRDRESLELISKKIDQLDDQEQMGGRLAVINAGEIPLSPDADRRLKFAAAGGVLGLMLPIGLFGLLGILHQRYKYADETVSDLATGAPLLGILPTLEEPAEHAKALLAAQRVHQIRVMLQVGRPPQQSVSYLITSASAGEGKTSLAMGLGLSFAATGARTLLIDGDLVSQRLTRGMEARDLPGLHEALRSGSLQGCLRRTDAGLCVLPAGNAEAHDACALSPSALKRLMREARRYFDTIVIDSGPVLGSVEASLLAQDVDGVVLTVARGQQPPLVRHALRQLNSLGANVCGFVFNRARTTDFYGSYYGSSSRSSSGPEPSTHSIEVQRRCRLGPLVAAVVSSLPTWIQPSMS